MVEIHESISGNPMTSHELRNFLVGNRVEAVDPDSLELFTIVSYLKDGTCQFELPTGAVETGRYGFEGGYYWTRYKTFRDGKVNHFSLVRLDGSAAQAYFADGRRAYLQRVLGPIDL